MSADVTGHWVRSHEEDTSDERVFRPATYGFPPARGRESFELRADGSYTEHGPGPADVPEEHEGTWSREGDRLVLVSDGDRPGHAWRIRALDADRLAVER